MPMEGEQNTRNRIEVASNHGVTRKLVPPAGARRRGQPEARGGPSAFRIPDQSCLGQLSSRIPPPDEKRIHKS